MTLVDGLFDGVLAAALPLVAWRLVVETTLREAVVLFVALGLLSAIAWTRLDAVDVALVEAALGTGVTGALLVSSLPWAETPLPPSAPRSPVRSASGLVLAIFVLYLGWAIFAATSWSAGLTEEVATNLDRSEVRHPITAVLLSFRGYDTLLEVAVLLVAALGVRAIQPVPWRRDTFAAPDVLAAFVDLLVPVGIVIAGYLVWEGSHAPGGAFQASSVIAGCGVVLLLAGRIRPPGASRVVRATLVIGPGLFLAVAGAPLVFGEGLLTYPRGWAGSIILAIELALTPSIALILLMFFPAPETASPVPTRRAVGAP